MNEVLVTIYFYNDAVVRDAHYPQIILVHTSTLIERAIDKFCSFVVLFEYYISIKILQLSSIKYYQYEIDTYIYSFIYNA